MARACGPGYDCECLHHTLWILPATALARGFADAIGKAIQALFALFFAMFFLRLALGLASMGSTIVWEVLQALVPVGLPDWLEVTVDIVGTLLAEGTFLTLMLGTTWATQRESYARWVSGESSGDDRSRTHES